MKKFLAAAALLVSSVVLAQQKDSLPNPNPARTAAGITGASGTAGLTGPQKPGPKAYKEVVTDKAITKKGLFTVHKVEEKYYFEIPDSLFNREIMAITRYSKVPSNGGLGRGIYGGELANQQTLAFEKGPNNTIFLRVITLVNVADSTNQIYKAVSNSNLNAIANAFPVAAFGKDSTSVLVDVTDFFRGDNQVVSISPGAKRGLNLTSLAQDRSYIQKISTFPLNTEVRTVKTFGSAAGFGGSLGGPVPSLSVPAANAAGAVTIEMNTSMILLPARPMSSRPWDKRVGYFPDDFTVYNDDQQKVANKQLAVRWRMEPKEPDRDKWKRGELVDPEKPIIYYIDPATPKHWRKYLIAGVNDWQKAFEKAGFKNAIMAREWPESDTSMSMEDARYSVIRYFASDVENAYGPNIHDPRSGEILESHIGWYHNVMKLVHDWYMVQTAAVDPRARKMKFDDELMGDLIRFVSSHEVGHTLGLLHNMGSSSTTPVALLRNKAWVEANGHTGSIMDYARFNYVAQPEDNIGKEGLYPRIGDYDKWAIRWGYGYIPGATEEEQKKNSNQLIIETLKNNPRTWFGTYEFGNQADPRSQSEDLGDNAVKASEYGIKNLQRILVKLPEWTSEETDLNENISVMYTQLLTQFRRYAGHVTRNVGGVYETFKSDGQNEPVYEITPKSMQRDAVAFLNKQLFQTPKWLINKDILNKFNNPVSIDPVASAQDAALASLLSYDRLNRMQVCMERFGAGKAYNALELLNDVQTDLFSELKNNRPIDQYRRLLQKSYVDKLGGFLDPGGAATISIQGFGNITAGMDKRSDVPAIARAQLAQLRNQVSAAANNITDQMSKIHLLDLANRIKRTLDPKS
ncbi:MAG: zinc-dependent metalloprotease [Sediminibacterium sp.]